MQSSNRFNSTLNNGISNSSQVSGFYEQNLQDFANDNRFFAGSIFSSQISDMQPLAVGFYSSDTALHNAQVNYNKDRNADAEVRSNLNESVSSNIQYDDVLDNGNNIPVSDLEEHGSVEEASQLEGIAEEGLLESSTKIGLSIAATSINSSVMNSIDDAQLQLSLEGQGPEGQFVGAKADAESLRSTQNTYTAIGSGIMGLGMMSDNPYVALGSVVVGGAVETLGPALTNTEVPVNATAGGQITFDNIN